MNLPKLIENPLFAIFWKEYPHKVGKQQAIKAWNKLAPNEDDLETILKALRRQKQSKMWQEGIGIPHPSTYLNQTRFMDEPIPEPENKQQGLAWWSTNDLMLAKGREFGISPNPGEGWPEFKSRLSSKISKSA